MMRSVRPAVLAAVCFAMLCVSLLAAQPVGIFEDHADVGAVLHPGAAAYDPAIKTYTITGSGENMWFGTDAFQFVWKRTTSNDLTLTANIEFVGESGEPHRKAVLMVRQNLDPQSPYADATLHGNGLTCLQFRPEHGANTDEVQSKTSDPKRVRLVKEGNTFTVWIGSDDGKWTQVAGPVTVPMHGSFYVGLGVCSHDKDKSETAKFTNVQLTEVPR